MVLRVHVRYLAWWLSWLERRPVTAEVVGSNPIRVVYRGFFLSIIYIWDLSSAGRASALQAEGHRFEPYRSHSLIIYWWCVRRCGGIGRRKGLKIPHVYSTQYRANPWFYWVSRKSKNFNLFIHRKYPSKYQGKSLRLMYIHTMLVWRNRQTQGT